MSEGLAKKWNILTYLRQSKEELEKVSWPSRDTTIRYSLLVVGTTVVLSATLALLDGGLSIGLQKLIELTAK